MTVLDVAYVELFAGDDGVAGHLVDGFGLTPVADCAETDRHSVLLAGGSVRVVVTTGPATAGFLRAHGDGVADLAFTCDDVEATARSAVAAGARALPAEHGQPALAGPGDVRYSLVPAGGAGDAARPFPPGRPWSARAGVDADAVAGGPVRSLDHLAVCLASGTLEEQAAHHEAAFGFTRISGEFISLGEQAMDSIVVRNDSGAVTFTLVAPVPGRDAGQLGGFLERNGGPGVQHLAFAVDDIGAAVTELRSRGVRFLSAPDSYYDDLPRRLGLGAERVAELRSAQVLADRDEWGDLLQIFTSSPLERNTLFFELIERAGSRGFGSANIRALYEAVERDRLDVR